MTLILSQHSLSAADYSSAADEPGPVQSNMDVQAVVLGKSFLLGYAGSSLVCIEGLRFDCRLCHETLSLAGFAVPCAWI